MEEDCEELRLWTGFFTSQSDKTFRAPTEALCLVAVLVIFGFVSVEN